jgi:hypothetical protein
MKKQLKAKENLIKFHEFKNCDFYLEENIVYTISKDDYMEKCLDVWEERELTRKENFIKE